MFGWEFPPHITGGLGTACYGMTKSLSKKSVETIFVVPKAYGDEDRKVASIIGADGFHITEQHLGKEFMDKVLKISIDSLLVPYVDPDGPVFAENAEVQERLRILHNQTSSFQFSGKYGSNLYEEVNRFALIAGLIAAEQEFDVIHAHDWLTFQAGITAKRVSGKPLVVHVHATEFDRSGENVNQHVFGIEKMGMEEADIVVCVSNLTKNIVVSRYGINPKKVKVVHNGVDFKPSKLLPEEKEKTVPEKVVTFMGRITYQKGPDYFVEAAYKVLERTPNVRFVMAGDGDMLKRLIMRVGELRMGDKFHFTGFLKGADVERMLANTDVFVMPSVSEPFGIAPLEAMRSKVPVIISKQSGVSEVLDYALKVDFWDVDALADAIYGLVTYPALASLLKQEGFVEASDLKWDKVADDLIKCYKQLA